MCFDLGRKLVQQGRLQEVERRSRIGQQPQCLGSASVVTAARSPGGQDSGDPFDLRVEEDSVRRIEHRTDLRDSTGGLLDSHTPGVECSFAMGLGHRDRKMFEDESLGEALDAGERHATDDPTELQVDQTGLVRRQFHGQCGDTRRSCPGRGDEAASASLNRSQK